MPQRVVAADDAVLSRPSERDQHGQQRHFVSGGATSRNSTLTIRTTSATPRGSYTLTITATGAANGGGGTATYTTRFTLTVQ